jgi:hypothetical protein
MDDLFQEPDNTTPLTPEEKAELIPAHIAYRAELNEAEQENIARGQDWALARKRDLLSEKFIKDLHGRMLGDVWRWAGNFRRTERNLGIHYYEIPMAVRQLLEDAKTWIQDETYPPDEIAVRFHHRRFALPQVKRSPRRLMTSRSAIRREWRPSQSSSNGFTTSQISAAVHNHGCQRIAAPRCIAVECHRPAA